uniref:Arp2/3 complex 34 kDa subunit n=1 Tax=Daucus carota subsp. sativus TaxID=79200 RepID=A0A166J1G3_DAUCS|nr:PREDICTED: actin-related protein 2/3 complex subunit 2A-like [Daucus carota subsp. sativus]
MSMILLSSHSKYLLDILSNRVENAEGVDIERRWTEFSDVCYHIKGSSETPEFLNVSVSFPTPPEETEIEKGLPCGATEAVKVAYGVVVESIVPPDEGFSLTLKLDLSKLPKNKEKRNDMLVKIAAVREVVLGAPLKRILEHLASRTRAPAKDRVITLVHRPKECIFLIPREDKVTVIYPINFEDSIDTVLATSFLQDLAETRRSASLYSAPSCTWSSTPPAELDNATTESLSVNAGFFTFVILPRHVEGKKLDRTVWILSTFHAYVSYHVKCSEAFMHTRMRRRVDSLIQALDRAKPESEKSEECAENRSFRGMSINNIDNTFQSSKNMDHNSQSFKITDNTSQSSKNINHTFRSFK